MNNKDIVNEYFDSVSADEVVDIINELEVTRGPCDEYCPYISAVCCGLPDGYKVNQAAKKGLVWACHSNSKIPCVATNLNSFPQGCLVITNSDEFIDLTNILLETT